MEELIKVDNKKIEDMIFEVRGKQVMLDSDVSMLFDYETKYLNRQVQRNINRFLLNYCFQLTNEECDDLRCQNVTSSLKYNHGGRRYNPYVFTEYGITMLAGILKSDVAIQISFKIVEIFIETKKYFMSNHIHQKYINELVLEEHKRL